MRPEPVFEARWHAQVFALTVHQNEAGRFTWSDWTARFGATLAAHGRDRDLDSGDDYFAAWLETLETMLAEQGLAEPRALGAVKAASGESPAVSDRRMKPKSRTPEQDDL